MLLVLFRAVRLVAVGTLFVVVAGYVFVRDHPAAAAFLIPYAVWAGVHTEIRARRRREEVADARLRDEHIPSMSPLEYEQFVARRLAAVGWAVRHVGRAGDQGCDVLAELRGFRAVVQVKLYRKPAGNDAVQQVVAARRHYDAQIMAVVCPAGFTGPAQVLAASNGVHLLHHTALAGLALAARIP
ncbi:MAG: restriction endonuclease [Burkholderiales bacterium]|nr:restriction endonuclease [Burkholderiales bacterium]